jgi:glycosyltransferase involved in cell wall biosynthesis
MIEPSNAVVSKPKIAILSLKNSYGYGGVLSSLKVTYDFCKKYFDPTVFFLGFEPSVATSLRNFKFSSSTQPLNYFGMKCIEVGARWAFWEPGHYKFNLKDWEKALEGFDYFLAASGTCICAHPLALLDKKFGMIISTPYEQDRAKRVNDLSDIRYLIDRLANKRMRQIEKFILDKASFIWALSDYSKKEFEEIMGGPANKIIRCGHPIDCALVPPLSGKDEDMIIAVGRFSDPRKNVEMLLRVFNKIYKYIPSVKLYVIGKAPEYRDLKRFIRLPFFQNVVFTGQVSAGDLESFYARASLMLLTSYQEGFGIVGLEALLHGVPVVATDCGGPSDYTIDDFTGYVVGIDDDEGMSERALSILLSKEKRALMSYQSQKFVIDNFSTDKIEELFKLGLTKIYPELHEMFNFKGDGQKTYVKHGCRISKSHFL